MDTADAPQSKSVVGGFINKTSLVIPRAKFEKSGTWRVRASFTITPGLTTSDEVLFVIAAPFGNLPKIQRRPLVKP